MDRLSASYLAASTASAGVPGRDKGVLSAQDEVELTKLVEYCVLLINQVRSTSQGLPCAYRRSEPHFLS
jgi:hypothetical protein